MTPRRIEVTIPGTPQPAVRMTARSKYVSPAAKRHIAWLHDARQAVAVALHQLHGIGSDAYPVYGPDVRLAVTVLIHVAARPAWDADNVGKLAVDALRGLVMADDQQVDTWQVYLRPAATVADERVTVIVSPIADAWTEAA